MISIHTLALVLFAIQMTFAVRTYQRVVHDDEITLIGGALAYSPPLLDVTVKEAVLKCFATFVGDAPQELLFTVKEGFRLCSSSKNTCKVIKPHMLILTIEFHVNFILLFLRFLSLVETLAISELQQLPDGRYLTWTSGDGYDIGFNEIQNGGQVGAETTDWDSSGREQLLQYHALCCSGRNYLLDGEGET